MPVKIDFIHRQDEESEIYFLINRRNTTETIDARFRVNGKIPEFWNPVDGSVIMANAFSINGYVTTVPMRLAPHQGIFVVFRESTSKTRQEGTNYINTVIDKTLDGAWELRFDPKWGGPAEPVVYQKLEDLTQSDIPGIKYYAGTVTYSKEFDLQEMDKDRLFLNLGDVYNIASVKLNGHDLGTIWCAPWKLDITTFCKPEDNKLEIEVTNTWWNRLVYDASLPVEQRLTKTNHGLSPRHSLLPAGLAGPVTIEREDTK